MKTKRFEFHRGSSLEGDAAQIVVRPTQRTMLEVEFPSRESDHLGGSVSLGAVSFTWVNRGEKVRRKLAEAFRRAGVPPTRSWQ